MAIQITSGGVSKTYRYYPYDAFYIDTNGNINSSGRGQQVKETYFNGVKYYPEDTNINYKYGGTKQITSNQNSYGFSVSATRTWEWLVNGSKYIPRYLSPNLWYPTAAKPTTPGWSSFLSWYKTYRWDSPDAAHEAPLLDATESFTFHVAFGQYQWIRDYLTSESQSLYDSLESGITISGRRFFQVIHTAYQTTGHENDIATVDGDAMILGISGVSMDTGASGRYGCTLYSAGITVKLYIDKSKCGEGTNIIRCIDGAYIIILVGSCQMNYYGISVASGVLSPYISPGGSTSENSYFEPIEQTN